MNKIINLEEKIKYVLIFLLILISLFFAFNYYPPITSLWETAEIYKYFMPLKSPPLVLSISEDPVLFGPDNVFGFPALSVSRYLSEYFGLSLSIIRLPSVIYGLFALYLFYIIIDRWFEWKVALISTFILASNHYFLVYQHLLLSPMITLTTILFCIERFQNLLKKNTKFAIFSFGFACALTTLNYWTARWCMLAILLFYLVDFERFSIWNYKSYLHFTNSKKIKNLFLVILSMIFILTIFYPGNIFLLFSSDFIFPSHRIGEYSDEIIKSFYNIWHNLGYFFKYYVLSNSYYPSDIMVHIPYKVESIIVIILFLLGIISFFTGKISHSTLFISYIFFITFFPFLLSETFLNKNYESSTSLSPHRVFFIIPFICIIAVCGIKYTYDYFKKKSFSSKPIFIFLIGIFLCFRLYGYFSEIKRLNLEINSYKIDFSKPAIAEGITFPHNFYFKTYKKIQYNQIYYYRLANFVSNYLQTKTSNLTSMNLLYIPEEIYTPFNYKMGGGVVPWKGYPYYFSMFLTFHLQEKGLNVSYLVKKEDVKETFLEKVIDVIDRYNKGENQPDQYPRNKKQEKTVIILSRFIHFIENYEQGKSWLNSIKDGKTLRPKTESIGDYFVNSFSKKTPKFLIVTNEEELNYVQKHSNNNLFLSLPLR